MAIVLCGMQHFYKSATTTSGEWRPRKCRSLVYGEFFFLIQKMSKNHPEIFLFFHFLKNEFRQVTNFATKKTTASHESSPFWFFYNTKLPKTTLLGPSHGGPARLHTQQAGALDTPVMARSAPHNASSVRLHQASSDQRESTLLHSVATHILSLSPSLPPFVSSFFSRGMEPASEEEEEEAAEEKAW